LLKQLCIVAEFGDASHQPEDWILARRLAVLFDFALGCVPIARDLIL
jgi:hypothetical protein